MQEVASEFAREYNRRKGRMNACWGDNFHATLVESGRHLRECLGSIELNMKWCGRKSIPCLEMPVTSFKKPLNLPMPA